jgi:hypothetical protein
MSNDEVELNARTRRMNVRLGWILAVACALLVGVVAVYLETFGGELSRTHSRWAEFGDFAGGVLGPSFALLGLLGLLLTISLQAQELSESTLQLTRSASALDAQLAAIRRQSHEDAVFQLLSFLREIVREMRLPRENGGTDLRGGECIAMLVTLFNRSYTWSIGRPDNSQRIEREAIAEAYDQFFRAYEAAVGHYFRCLHELLSLVRSGDPQQQIRLSRVVKSQLSSNELLLLFYHCLSQWGWTQLKPLVERFGILEHVPRPALHQAHHMQGYALSAFLPVDQNIEITTPPTAES